MKQNQKQSKCQLTDCYSDFEDLSDVFSEKFEFLVVRKLKCTNGCFCLENKLNKKVFIVYCFLNLVDSAY